LDLLHSGHNFGVPSGFGFRINVLIEGVDEKRGNFGAILLESAVLSFSAVSVMGDRAST
jgi:hypothetical protein